MRKNDNMRLFWILMLKFMSLILQCPVFNYRCKSSSNKNRGSPSCLASSIWLGYRPLLKFWKENARFNHSGNCWRQDMIGQKQNFDWQTLGGTSCTTCNPSTKTQLSRWNFPFTTEGLTTWIFPTFFSLCDKYHVRLWSFLLSLDRIALTRGILTICMTSVLSKAICCIRQRSSSTFNW